MPTNFKEPTFEELVYEQQEVQASKFQGRMLGEYNHYMFSGQEYVEPVSSTVTDFLRPICVGDKCSLEGLLRGLCSKDSDKKTVHWADMGGGRALPMREIASKVEFGDSLMMTNVDLFDYGLGGLGVDELSYLDTKFPGVLNDESAPEFINSNIETVSLPQPVDLITSVESIQYLNDPMRALANWYNQLSDDGLMIVSTETDWPSWIRYQDENGMTTRDASPIEDFLRVLTDSEVAWAGSAEPDYPNGFRPNFRSNDTRTLVVQKLAGTRLVVNSPVERVWVSPHDYKATYYRDPSLESALLVELKDAKSEISRVALLGSQ